MKIPSEKQYRRLFECARASENLIVQHCSTTYYICKMYIIFELILQYSRLNWCACDIPEDY